MRRSAAVGELAGVIEERVPPEVSADLRTRAGMLAAALDALDRAGIAWCAVSGCALHAGADGRNGRPADGSASAGRDDRLRTMIAQCDLDPDDIDLVVSREHFPRVPAALAAVPGSVLVRAWPYAAASARYDLVSFPDRGRPVFVALDVSWEVRAFGTVLMDAAEFMTARRRLGGQLWIPEPAVQFIFSLLKHLSKVHRLAKVQPDPSRLARLSALYRADASAARRQLRRFFPPASAARIASGAARGEWQWVFEHRRTLAEQLKRVRGRAHPLAPLRCRLAEPWRWMRRIARPTGLVVVLLGLDGSGKSTVMPRAQEDLGPVFSGSRRYHQRPRVLWAGTEDRTVRGPQTMPRRSRVGSLVKLAVWALDYWAGFVCQIFPQMVQSGLVLFDRYYYDLLVDPDRYRYGGPPAAARAVGRLLPRPALVILLDAPPEVTDARRRDGEFRSAARLRPAYASFVRALPGGRIVNAAQPLEAVVADVERAILEFLAQRIRRRLGATA